jgi:peptidoglycan/LPS O-acetylase OafA/YrhL
MRAAQQQRWHFDFTAINRLHVPVALASMLLAAILFGHGALRRRFDDLTLLAGTVTFAVLGNAFICAVISGPHDRYGARMAWLATTVVLIAAIRHFTADARDRSLPARQEVGDADLVDLVADGAHVVPVRNVEHLGARNDFPERRG